MPGHLAGAMAAVDTVMLLGACDALCGHCVCRATLPEPWLLRCAAAVDTVMVLGACDALGPRARALAAAMRGCCRGVGTQAGLAGLAGKTRWSKHANLKAKAVGWGGGGRGRGVGSM